MSDRVSEPSLDLLARGLRFVAELRELPRASVAQRRTFLIGLGSLVGAQIGISVQLRNMRNGWPVLTDPASFGWNDARHQALFLGYLEDQDRMPDPTLPALARIRDPIYIRPRQELADDRTWYRSEHVQELRRAAGMDHCLLGAARSGDVADAFSLHRPWGDRPFSAREVRLTEILYREAAPLIHEPLPLPPRQKAVLDGLCRGLSEKQIAAELAMSPHTVHDHVKQLHLRFGARSRGELLARVLAQ
jgi:DNA-binding CsgD family transcriptional regulator